MEIAGCMSQLISWMMSFDITWFLSVTRMKSKDLSDLSSDEFSSLFFFTFVIKKCQQLVYTHTFQFIPN